MLLNSSCLFSACWQPCPDVYWFPVVKPRFCKEFIEIMEEYGEWSDGSNKVRKMSKAYVCLN
jgi:hypothetical protein